METKTEKLQLEIGWSGQAASRGLHLSQDLGQCTFWGKEFSGGTEIIKFLKRSCSMGIAKRQGEYSRLCRICVRRLQESPYHPGAKSRVE